MVRKGNYENISTDEYNQREGGGRVIGVGGGAMQSPPSESNNSAGWKGELVINED